MTRLFAALFLVMAFVPPAFAADHAMMLAADTWVCQTQARYNEVKKKAASLTGKEARALRKDLREQEACLFVEEDDIEDMLAPFVQVVERVGDMVKVSFWLEDYRKLAELHRKILRVQFAGWTEKSRLRTYEDFYK